MHASPTPERLSLLLGLVVLMLATVPRYLAGGHQTRLTLILIALAVVTSVAVVHWRLLADEARRRLPALLRRLAIGLAGGLAGMGLWHVLVSDWFSWQELIAQGTTLGVLLHALWLWWQRDKG